MLHISHVVQSWKMFSYDTTTNAECILRTTYVDVCVCVLKCQVSHFEGRLCGQQKWLFWAFKCNVIHNYHNIIVAIMIISLSIYIIVIRIASGLLTLFPLQFNEYAHQMHKFLCRKAWNIVLYTLYIQRSFYRYIGQNVYIYMMSTMYIICKYIHDTKYNYDAF